MDDIEIYKKAPDILYDDVFFNGMRKCKEWQNYVGRKLYENFNINRSDINNNFMVDFGCGLGYYIEGAKKRGAIVKGYEYMYNTAKKYMSEDIAERVQYGNVMDEIDTGGKWTFSMAIEVAEHILPEKSDVLVNNLVLACRNFIVFSAAPEDQTGQGHINLHPKEFWEEKFNRRGYFISKPCTGIIKSYFDRNMDDFKRNVSYANAKYLHVIRKNLMVLMRGRQLKK